MGAWSVNVTGNDTAMDLRAEYTCAFYRYEPAEAVRILDDYVRKEGGGPSDPEEWCNYVYSLADFMWKKGILTDEIKQRALSMIDSGFGLEIWAESGEKILMKRKKVLGKFREQLCSPLPEKKKIKPDVHMERIFEDGDVVAIQLITKGKPVASRASLVSDLSEADFHACDGKYILLQKDHDLISWQSKTVPEIRDHWAMFRLFDGVYDEVPEHVDINQLREAKILDDGIKSLFLCESSMFYFRKRKYRVVGHQVRRENEGNDGFADLFLGVSNESHDPDAMFLASMGRTVRIEAYDGPMERLFAMAGKENRYRSYENRVSPEENERRRKAEETEIQNRILQAWSEHAAFYTISFGKECGFASLLQNRIDNLYISGRFRRLGLGTQLVRALSEKTVGQAYMPIPAGRYRDALLHICEKTGVRAAAEPDQKGKE